MDHWCIATHAGRYEGEGSERSIFPDLVLRVDHDEDGKGPENSNLPVEVKVNAAHAKEVDLNWVGGVLTHHRPVDDAFPRFAPEDHVYG